MRESWYTVWKKTRKQEIIRIWNWNDKRELIGARLAHACDAQGETSAEGILTLLLNQWLLKFCFWATHISYYNIAGSDHTAVYTSYRELIISSVPKQVCPLANRLLYMCRVILHLFRTHYAMTLCHVTWHPLLLRKNKVAKPYNHQKQL